jgi:3-hydroxyisobutyrate dehydrogenase-like beta-hydroxyacid dehydrogenase
MEVGFIGLGDQGGPMAQMIARAGHALHVWARRPASYQRLGGERYTPQPDPARLGARCDWVGLCVTADDDVRQTVFDRGLLAALRPGSLLLIHSTVSVATCQEIARAAGPRGVEVLDAPVSGGGQKALARELTVMVGGAADAFERARPVLEAFGDPICHLGPLGAGQRCKLLNNGLYNAHWYLGRLAGELAVGLGLEREAFFRVLERSSGASYGAQVQARVGLRAVPHTAKDVGLVEAELQALGVGDNELRALWRACAALVQALAPR